MHRILSIEDDPIMYNLLRTALKAEGFEFCLRTTGGEALEAAISERPDLIILDIHLPDINGHDVCKKLKNNDKTKDIPIIMLTGQARETQQRVAGLDHGAEDYLFKPISPRVLISRIRSILKITSRPSGPS